MSSKVVSEPTPDPEHSQPSRTIKTNISDFLAFSSIITSYFFLSLTLHLRVFETFLGLEFNSPSLIATAYLVYALLILLLKCTSWVMGFVKSIQGPQLLDQEVNTSLLTVLALSSVYILINSLVPFSLQELCHVTIWLWVGETTRILGNLFGRFLKLDSLSYFGISIEVMLFLGALLQPLELGIFSLF